MQVKDCDREKQGQGLNGPRKHPCYQDYYNSVLKPILSHNNVLILIKVKIELRGRFD